MLNPSRTAPERIQWPPFLPLPLPPFSVFFFVFVPFSPNPSFSATWDSLHCDSFLLATWIQLPLSFLKVKPNPCKMTWSRNFFTTLSWDNVYWGSCLSFKLPPRGTGLPGTAESCLEAPEKSQWGLWIPMSQSGEYYRVVVLPRRCLKVFWATGCRQNAQCVNV